MARSSLLETQNHLIDARDRAFLSSDEFDRLWTPSEEAIAVTTGLLRYLDGGSKRRGS